MNGDHTEEFKKSSDLNIKNNRERACPIWYNIDTKTKFFKMAKTTEDDIKLNLNLKS